MNKVEISKTGTQETITVEADQEKKKNTKEADRKTIETINNDPIKIKIKATNKDKDNTTTTGKITKADTPTITITSTETIIIRVIQATQVIQGITIDLCFSFKSRKNT